MALQHRQEQLRQSRTPHTNSYGRPPLDVKIMADCMLKVISRPPLPYCTPPTSTRHGATDAGANDDSATVGGWTSHTATPHKNKVRWFCIPITRTRHPWAYAQGSPQRIISALELYGTLLLYRDMSAAASTSSVTLPIKTDNKGKHLQCEELQGQTMAERTHAHGIGSHRPSRRKQT